MENRRPHAATVGTLIGVLVMLSGCQAAPATWLSSAPQSVARTLSVAQVTLDGKQRFVLCDAAACPRKSTKTPANVSPTVMQTRRQAQPHLVPAESGHTTSIDIPFAFNKQDIRPADRRRLRTAMPNVSYTTVTVTGRSDAAGPAAVRQRIARARASVVRDLVRDIDPDATITVRHEVATGPSPGNASRRHQRRATVQFSTFPTRP